MARVQHEEFAPLSLLRWIVENYDHAVHHPMIISSPMGFNQLMMNCHATRALAVYGDVALARKWTLKSIDIYENMDIRTDPSLFAPGYYGSLNMTNSFMMKAGLGDLVLRYMKAAHLTFSEVDDTAETFYACTKFFGFVGETHKYGTPDTLAAQMKRRHWLLAPDEVGKGAMEEWLKTVPAECGSAAQDKVIDCYRATVGYMAACDCADVFESLERYEEAITAAQVDIKNYEILPSRHHPVLQRHRPLPGQARAAGGGHGGVPGRDYRGARLRAAVPGAAGAARLHRARAGRGGAARGADGGAGRRDQPHGDGAGRVHRDPGVRHRRGGGGGGVRRRAGQVKPASGSARYRGCNAEAAPAARRKAPRPKAPSHTPVVIWIGASNRTPISPPSNRPNSPFVHFSPLRALASIHRQDQCVLFAP